LPAFVTLQGLLDPPPGDLLLVLRRKAGFLDLFRSQPPESLTVAVSPQR
jgi:hypothetical protein